MRDRARRGPEWPRRRYHAAAPEDVAPAPATFCVNTRIGLQNVLNTAATNGADNLIKPVRDTDHLNGEQLSTILNVTTSNE
jgi:hypothetical protein